MKRSTGSISVAWLCPVSQSLQGLWASMRSQTFWRTVEGCMCLAHVLIASGCQVLSASPGTVPSNGRAHQPSLQVEVGCFRSGTPFSKPSSSLKVFTCMGCMQQYAYFDRTKLDHADQLLLRFPRQAPCAIH